MDKSIERLEEMKANGIQGAVCVLTAELASYEDHEKAIETYGKDNVFFAKMSPEARARMEKMNADSYLF